MGLKILHSADWHLDSPFASFSKEQRTQLQNAQRKIPEKIAEICRRESCDLVLLAGDLFDGEASRESIGLVKEALRNCAVPVFISPGNHDFCTPDSPWETETWPENVHIFRGSLESVGIPALNCRVYGAGYRSMDCPGLLENFRATGEERYQIAVLHGDPLTLRSPCCPVKTAQVRDSGLDYLALGHIHKAGAFRAGDTLCGWPGCPMGRGWDETGEKGIYLVTLEETAALQAVELDAPCFYEMDVAVESDATAALEAALPLGGSYDFYRITLTGSGEADTAALKQQFDRFPNLELRDRMEKLPDLWAEAGEDTLRGTYFRLLREKMEQADSDSAEQIRLAAELSRRLLSGREVTLP